MDIIQSFFEKIAEQNPDAIALVHDDRIMSYGELNNIANQFAYYLQTMGVVPGMSVAIGLDRSINLLIVMMGILKAGAAYVPLDPTQPKARLLYILNDSHSQFLITESLFNHKFTGYSGTVMCFDQIEDVVRKLPYSQGKSNIVGHHIAYIIYTSGSTGAPKGVLIAHKSVTEYGLWFADYSQVKPNQRIDFSSNYIFDMAITTSIVPLMLGLTIVICDDTTKKHLARYLQYLQSKRVNIIKMTPSYLKVLLSDVTSSPRPLPDLKILVLGGENLQTSICKNWLDIYPRHILYNEYGPTEATVGVSCYKVTNDTLSLLGNTIPIGIPSRRAKFFILDKNLKKVPTGDIGELYITGNCLAQGYLNQPTLTEEKFINSPLGTKEGSRIYKTGDLCRQLDDGVFEYFGRVDNQVKIQGFRIELEEIQCGLQKHHAIKDVIVLAVENNLQEPQLVAYLIAQKSTIAPTPVEFRRFLQERLPSYMIPSAFVWVGEFPLTDNGKLNQSQLPSPDYFSHHSYVAPRTTLEEKIAKLWSDTLGISLIGVEDNFFELGGHSLAAVKIISLLEKILNRELLLSDLYHLPTISQFAKFIETTQPDVKLHLPSKNLLFTGSHIRLNDFQFMFWIGDLVETKVKKLNIFGRRRIVGQIDRDALQIAFEHLLKKNETLRYRINKIIPSQVLQNNLMFKIHERNLIHLTREEGEEEILTSFEDLIDYGPWPKNSPRILVKLFFLQDNQVELQIAMPHIVSDHISVDVLFDSLSSYYIAYKCRISNDDPNENQRFKEYLSYRQEEADSKLERNLNFWKDYLKDASFFNFPKALVIKDMSSEGYSYSTYMEIPEKALVNLQQFCAGLKISMTDGLCASLSLALANGFKDNSNDSKKLFLSIIKSTRDQPIYDDKIGCFLRLDAIKLDINNNPSLTVLSKQVHQSIINTMSYQQCPGLLKLACVDGIGWVRRKAINYVLYGFIYLYTKLFPSLKLNPKLIALYSGLMRFWKNDSFYIYVNILTNFIEGPKQQKKPELFGLKTLPSKLTHHDLSKINHVLEFCFLRDELHNKPYLVISGNLIPSARKLIATEIIRIFQNETKISSHSEKSNLMLIKDPQ
jgi:amino acid adenylation domain-containing protein